MRGNIGGRLGTTVLAAAICGAASPAWAQPTAGDSAPPSADADLKAQVQALKSEVAQLKARQNARDHQSWLNKRRSEEVKKIVRDVMNESRTRSLLRKQPLGRTNMIAGYNGKHFFLSSPDGNFKLAVEGQLQFRYLFNSSDQGGAEVDENVGGFQVRRAKIGFFGNILNPKLTYKIKGAFNRSSGSFNLEEGWLAYQFADKWQAKAGAFAEPFLREVIVSSSAQQAVDRSATTNYFTGIFTKGATLAYNGDPLRVVGGVTSGPGQQTGDFNHNVYEYDLLGRVDYLLAGKYSEFKDFAAFSDDPFGVLVGAGVSYAKGANGPFSRGDALKYTADVSAKFGNGVNAFAALEGQHVYDQNDPAVSAADQIGFLAQLGAFVIPDKLDVFGRYEYTNLDGVVYNNRTARTSPASSDINLITAGTNYYFKGHAAKATFDVSYALDQLPFGNTGLGLLPDADRGQVVGRAQLQLLF